MHPDIRERTTQLDTMRRMTVQAMQGIIRADLAARKRRAAETDYPITDQRNIDLTTDVCVTRFIRDLRDDLTAEVERIAAQPEVLSLDPAQVSHESTLDMLSALTSVELDRLRRIAVASARHGIDLNGDPLEPDACQVCGIAADDGFCLCGADSPEQVGNLLRMAYGG